MKTRFLAPLLFSLVACCPSHPPGKSENAGNSNTNKYLSAGQIDSMADARLGYFMKQIGDTTAFEKYYGKKFYIIRKEFIEKYTDSLGKK